MTFYLKRLVQFLLFDRVGIGSSNEFILLSMFINRLFAGNINCFSSKLMHFSLF